jgi:hypothetical protein
MTIEAPIFGEETEADADENIEHGQDLDNSLEEITERDETYEMSDSEKKYYATDLGRTKKIDTSEKAMAGLSPAERKQRLYAEAAAYYHEYDRQAAQNPDTANKDLLRKGNELYEKADRLYPDEMLAALKKKDEPRVTAPKPSTRVTSGSSPSLSQIYTQEPVEKKSTWSRIKSWFR